MAAVETWTQTQSLAESAKLRDAQGLSQISEAVFRDKHAAADPAATRTTLARSGLSEADLQKLLQKLNPNEPEARFRARVLAALDSAWVHQVQFNWKGFANAQTATVGPDQKAALRTHDPDALEKALQDFRQRRQRIEATGIQDQKTLIDATLRNPAISIDQLQAKYTKSIGKFTRGRNPSQDHLNAWMMDKSARLVQKYMVAPDLTPRVIKGSADAQLQFNEEGQAPPHINIDSYSKTLFEAAFVDSNVNNRHASHSAIPQAWKMLTSSISGRFGAESYAWDPVIIRKNPATLDQLDQAIHFLRNTRDMQLQIGHLPNGPSTDLASRTQKPFATMLIMETAAHIDRLGPEKTAALLKQQGVFDPHNPLTTGDAFRKEFFSVMQMEYYYNGLDSTPPSAGEKLEHATASGGTIYLPASLLGKELDDAPALRMFRYHDKYRSPRPEAYAHDLEAMLNGVAHGREAGAVGYNMRLSGASGEDHNADRVCSDPDELSTTNWEDLAPPCLNAATAFNLRSMADVARAAGNDALANDYAHKADVLTECVRTLNWNSRLKTFTDYNFRDGTQTDKIGAWSAYPLHFKIATDDQAAGTAAAIEKYLLAPSGLRSSENDNEQQWCGQNEWAPHVLLVAHGLHNYGSVVYNEAGETCQQLAEKIEQRCLTGLLRYYAASGNFPEKLNANALFGSDGEGGGGEYAPQRHFLWTGALYGVLKTLHPEKCRELQHELGIATLPD